MPHLLHVFLQRGSFLLCFQPLTVWSQQPALTDSLGTAEVTAQRPVTGISTNTPTQRLSLKDIRQRGITDTGDALRRLAGVTLRDYGGAGGLKTVSVRGLGAAHTAVTFDGICLGETRQGQVDLQRFSIDQLAAIGLQTLDSDQLLVPVRNLAAAVVQLQSIQTPQHQSTGGTVSLRQASFQTWNPACMFRKKWTDHTLLTLGGSWFWAENNYPFVVKNGVATQRLRRNNSRMQTTTLEANVRHELNRGSLEGKLFFYHNHRLLPGQVILYVNENHEVLTEQNAFAQVRWTQGWGKFQVFTAAKFNDDRSRYRNFDAQYPGGAIRQNYRQNEGYVTAGVGWEPTTWLATAYATDVTHATLRSNLKTDQRVNRTTWLQSLSLRLHQPAWNVTARLVGHLSYNDRKNGEAATEQRKLLPSITGAICLINRPVQLRLRAGWKESFRLPSFTEAYYDHLGSTSLKPERTRQLNAGITLQAAPTTWWRTLSLTIDGYTNRVKNRIVSVPYNLFVWRTINMGKVHTAGIDVVMENRWQPSSHHQLIWAVNYSFQRAADHTSRGSKNYGNQLPYTPRHLGATSLTWENPWLSLTAHASFAGLRWSTPEHTETTQLPAYQEWGFTAYRRFTLGRHRLAARADLINAFNHRYEVIRRYPMPGRAYKLAVQWDF